MRQIARILVCLILVSCFCAPACADGFAHVEYDDAKVAARAAFIFVDINNRTLQPSCYFPIDCRLRDRTRHHPSPNHTRSNRDRLTIQHGSISYRSTISSDKSQHRRTILNKKFGMVARVRWFEYLCGRGGGPIFPPDFTRCRTISKRSIPPNTTQWSTTRVHR